MIVLAIVAYMALALFFYFWGMRLKDSCPAVAQRHLPRGRLQTKNGHFSAWVDGSSVFCSWFCNVRWLWSEEICLQLENPCIQNTGSPWIEPGGLKLMLNHRLYLANKYFWSFCAWLIGLCFLLYMLYTEIKNDWQCSVLQYSKYDTKCV